MAQCSSVILFDHCQYGATFRKCTKVAIWNFDGSDLQARCTGKQICSRTGKPHELLSGIDPLTKEFFTARGAAYPKSFCAKMAQQVVKAGVGVGTRKAR